MERLNLDFKKWQWNLILENCEFTDEELELIPYFRRGLYQEDIAATLNMSRSTVARRKKKICDKIIDFISEYNG